MRKGAPAPACSGEEGLSAPGLNCLLHGHRWGLTPQSFRPGWDRVTELALWQGVMGILASYKRDLGEGHEQFPLHSQCGKSWLVGKACGLDS